MLEELLHISELFDLYGALLTERQQQCLTMHLFEDFSLSEIGESLGISRQAVYDMLHRAEQTMEGYESRLGFLARRRQERIELGLIYRELAALDVQPAKPVAALLKRLAPFTDQEREV